MTILMVMIDDKAKKLKTTKSVKFKSENPCGFHTSTSSNKTGAKKFSYNLWIYMYFFF